MPTMVLNGQRVDVAVGQSILTAAHQAQPAREAQPASPAAEEIASSCPGAGECKECIVQIQAGHDGLTPWSPHEAFLEQRSDSEGQLFRLACQAKFARDDALVYVETFKRQLDIATTGRPAADTFEPWIERRGETIYCDGQPFAEHAGPIHGLAIDVGTTTVVIHAVDLESGQTLAVRAFENPQRYGGSDVMHRISSDRDHPGQLHRTIVAHINNVLTTLPFDPTTVLAITVAGNPTMRDLLFGLDVQSLGQKPFVSVTQAALIAEERGTTAVWADAGSLGLHAHPNARVYGLPLVSHHVGADTAAVLGTLPIADHAQPFMMIDLGTNTEIVAGTRDRLVAASCAAGPAFEGGRVACGMTACQGAITRLRRVDNRWDLSSIGDVPIRGICGSGLVDILAELRATGEMDELGRLHDGTAQVTVSQRPPLRFTRADASELAQTIAAIGLGQVVLLRKLALDPSQIATCYLAGAFANQIDLANAQRIGLLAQVPDDRVVRIGNAAIEGAKAALLSRTCRQRIEDLVHRVEHVPLEAEPDFFDLFAEMTRLRPIEMTP